MSLPLVAALGLGAARLPLADSAIQSPELRAAATDADQRSAFEEVYGQTLRRIHRVTAYCDRGLTAAGIPSGVGQCAAPADIPFGSKIYIPALDRTFIVTDRTAKRFRDNTVDLFMPERDECLEFGRSYLECHISIPVNRPRYGSHRLTRALATLDS